MPTTCRSKNNNVGDSSLLQRVGLVSTGSVQLGQVPVNLSSNRDPPDPTMTWYAVPLLKRSCREQAYGVVFTVQLHPRSLRVRADLGEDVARDVDRPCAEHAQRYFDTKAQCTHNSRNTESFAPNISFFPHRPTVCYGS
jgi:hypothetical protein